jgi:hypothetical protein
MTTSMRDIHPRPHIGKVNQNPRKAVAVAIIPMVRLGQSHHATKVSTNSNWTTPQQVPCPQQQSRNHPHAPITTIK